MRRKVRRHEEDNNFRNILLVSGSILGLTIIALVITFFVYVQKLNNNTTQSILDTTSISELLPKQQEELNKTTIASSPIGKKVEESEKENVVKTTEKTTVETVNNNTQNQIVEVKETKPEPIPDPTFVKPVEGTIMKEFAKENLVYSETLQEWTTHLGIDISAEKTTVVKAASTGKIKAIKNDPRYGLTIIMEHANGYTSVYSNLLSTEFVVIGEEIEQGESIGTVGNTATFEVADDYHLHFEILKDNIPLDPMMYIK